jgi:FkbM family methyltransferase
MSLRKRLRKEVDKVADKLGVEVRRTTVANSDAKRLAALLGAHDIDTILDVGANRGQYGTNLRRLGYRGQILSFEPLSDAHAALVKVASNDPAWTVAPPMALGDEDGTTTINVSANSFSSSLLPLGDLHRQAAPQSEFVGTEEVQLSRLDTVLPTLIALDGKAVFLKLDVQGFETSVLRGATELLKGVRGVQIELSLVTLYEGQDLYMDVIGAMVELGFELYAIEGGFTDPQSGRMLQADGIFFRPEPA